MELSIININKRNIVYYFLIAYSILLIFYGLSLIHFIKASKNILSFYDCMWIGNVYRKSFIECPLLLFYECNNNIFWFKFEKL